MNPEPRYLHSGDTALVVEFGEHIDARVSGLVLALAQRVAGAAIAGVVELVPTFRSLMVHYDPLQLTQQALKARLGALLRGLEAAEQEGRHWRVPTCYDGSVGLDLAEVAQRTGMTVPQVIECHSAPTYHVYMVGFLPGFPYLGGLPKQLELPRRENPRLKVPQGSIAIAMAMTGVYTLESPGGWHILGRTPVPLWDIRRDPPAPIAAGDKIKFQPIPLAEHEALLRRAAEGKLWLEPEAPA